jgi:predicted permease
MLPIVALVALGFFLDRQFKLEVKTISKILFYLVIPSFVFTNLYKTNFPQTGIPIMATVIALLFVGRIIGNIVSKVRHYDISMTEAFRNAVMFNNTGNLGVALILLIFSHDPFVVDGQTPYLAEAMVVQIMIFVIQSISLNTLGLYQAGRGQLSVHDTLRAMFRIPMIYMVIIAIVVKNLGIDAQSFFLWPVMEMSGSAILPLAMLAIGVQLSRTKIEWLNREVWLASFIKLILFPIIGLVTIFLWNYFAPGTFSPVAAIVFLIYCAVPTAVNTAMYAIEFNNQPEYATQVVMNTTALSAITMTVFIFIGNIIYM